MLNYNIDKSKLSRDYENNPLSKINGVWESLSKEDLYELYINVNMKSNDIAEYLHTTNKHIRHLIAKYDIKKDRKKAFEISKRTNLEKYGSEIVFNNLEIIEKTKKTNLKKYGVESYSKTNSFKRKIKQTKLKRYGDENYNNQEKIKETTLKRYGDENYRNISQTKKTKLERYGDEKYVNVDKIKQTKLERYGDENYNNQDKIKNTCLKKFGSSSYSNIHISDETKQILNDEKLLESYIIDNKIENGNDLGVSLGVGETTALMYAKKYGLNKLFTYNGSVGEKEVRDFINQYYETINNSRKIIPPYELDIFIPEKNIAIEYNGDYWHLMENKKEIDIKKQKMCNFLGIKLITIWESSWKKNKEDIKKELLNIINT